MNKKFDRSKLQVKPRPTLLFVIFKYPFKHSLQGRGGGITMATEEES